MFNVKLLFSLFAVVLGDVAGFRLNDGIGFPISRSSSRRHSYPPPQFSPQTRPKTSESLTLGQGPITSDISTIGKSMSFVRYPLHLRGGATVVLSAASASAPALSAWIGPALACALSYALYNLFIKKASASMDPILGGVLLQVVAAALGATLLAVQRAKSSATALEVSKMGVRLSIAAGAAVGAAEILSFIISGLGVPASKSIPAIIGGSVVMGTFLGAVWLGEQLTPRGWFGIALIAVGIALVGMDPGASLH
mmetsp:Transcript_5886/g.9891  ORF Transcript_5886/g.9891 Transcript_5886/m.9891 type:complete len:253 (-) Transcript_5886:128-886(-)